MTVLILPLYFLTVWLIIDRHERKLNKTVKDTGDFPVIYKTRTTGISR